MHARIEQLLKALPQLDPPRSSWERIQAQLARSQRARERRARYRLVAIAAAVVVTVAAVLVAGRIVGWDGSMSPLASDGPTPAMSSGSASDDARHVAELVAESQHLDSLLQALPERPRIERVSTAATIDTIEERIQWLDFQLSATPEPPMSDAQARRLWRERVELMDSLVKVRYAEAGRTSF